MKVPFIDNFRGLHKLGVLCESILLNFQTINFGEDQTN